MNIEGHGGVSIKNQAHHCTTRGRVVYDRKPHLFGFRDAERILRDIVADGQISFFERFQLVGTLLGEGNLQAIMGILDLVRAWVFGEPNLLYTIATWMFDLGDSAFFDWLYERINERRVK